jgi:hypothetical protein
MDNLMQQPAILDSGIGPRQVASWLEWQGWALASSLGEVAERWSGADVSVIVPLQPSSPDFHLRWNELLSSLSRHFQLDTGGILLAIKREGSDIAEFCASGAIDDSIPLGDATVVIDSLRRAMQAAANSAIQPRSYFGHSIPDTARGFARNVRMGLTRSGSYVIPVISSLPILREDEPEDARLFDDVFYKPFARSAMLQLAGGIAELRRLTHSEQSPSRSEIAQSVGRGVSAELCDAIAGLLETQSVESLRVAFTWAERLPVNDAPASVMVEEGAVRLIRDVGNYLRGEPVVGLQTVVGYVKRLDRGEDDEVGRVTIRILDSDKARNVILELDDQRYHIAGEANTNRELISATGILHREPGRMLRLSEVASFHLLERSIDLDQSSEGS